MNRIIPSTEAIQRDAPGAGVWRDIARLAAEALAIGLAFSVLLALAVFMVARSGGHDGVELSVDSAAYSAERSG